MKITKVQTIRVEEFANLIYLRLHTDEGIVGLGETYFGPQAVEAWIHETAAPYLVGQDPLAIERHWANLNPFVGFNTTGVENRGRSAVDVALWDILGKVAGQPLYQLLGGKVHDAVEVYNTCAGYQYVRNNPKTSNLPVDNWGVQKPTEEGPYEDLYGFLYHADDLARSLVDEGYTGMKIWPFDSYAEPTRGQSITTENLKKGLEPFKKIRDAVGDQIRIMVELHSKWGLPAAKQIAQALEEYGPYWFEDPIKMDNLDALAQFHDSTRVRTTGSETLATRWSFRRLLERGAVDVVMFDPTWVGGVSESKKIAHLAETYQLPIAPHDCQGPVEFSVAVHVAVSSPNTLIQEVVRAFFTTWYRELATEVPEVKDGRVSPLEAPGVGTELRPGVLDRSDLSIRETVLD